MKLADKDFPVVVMDRELHGKYISSVLIDNKGSAYQVGEHIHKLGMKKTGCLMGPGFDGEQRMEGFMKAVEEFELDIRPEWIINAEWKEKIAYEKIQELVQNKELPEVIFAFNDEMAKGCMDALKALQIKIPEEVSVIGMDDIVISAYLEPKLTTVHRPLYNLGVTAAETLLQMLDGGKSKKVVLSTHLIERESCKK